MVFAEASRISLSCEGERIRGGFPERAANSAGVPGKMAVAAGALRPHGENNLPIATLLIGMIAMSFTDFAVCWGLRKKPTIAEPVKTGWRAMVAPAIQVVAVTAES